MGARRRPRRLRPLPGPDRSAHGRRGRDARRAGAAGHLRVGAAAAAGRRRRLRADHGVGDARAPLGRRGRGALPLLRDDRGADALPGLDGVRRGDRLRRPAPRDHRCPRARAGLQPRRRHRAPVALGHDPRRVRARRQRRPRGRLAHEREPAAARPAHRPPEPPAVQQPAHPGARAPAASPRPLRRRAVPRPRSLQGHQRQPRACGRRQADRRGRRAPAPRAAPARDRLALRRRRVRDPVRGHPRRAGRDRRRRARAARVQHPDQPHARRGRDVGEPRHRAVRRSRPGHRQPDSRRRRRDVPRQGGRRRATDAVRRGHAPARAHTPAHRERAAPRDRARGVPRLLPARGLGRDRGDRRRRGARALGAPGRRARRARPLHRARRGDRPDRPDRHLGPPGGMPLAGRALRRQPRSSCA